MSYPDPQSPVPTPQSEIPHSAFRIPHSPSSRRAAWVAATRGDFLLLGPLFQEFKRRREPGVAHWLLDTGEAGMAALQARDLLGLVPDETFDLCHPADEPAIRLALMLERAESFIRRHKGTHVVFSGFGPTAAGTAIYCHARGCKGLWLRPPDPAGLAPRLRWEAGLERMIRACAPCVEVWQIPGAPDFSALLRAGEGSAGLHAPSGAPAARPLPLETEIPGLRAGAPLMLIAVLRRDWGYLDDATSRVARAAAAWAAAHPDSDFLIVSNLNARLEGPVRSLADRPANLLLAPPLPYPLYDAVLSRARLVLTDGPLIAAEALGRGLPVATLGDLPAGPEPAAPPVRHTPILPAGLESAAWAAEISARLAETPQSDFVIGVEAQNGDIYGQIRQAIEAWLK